MAVCGKYFLLYFILLHTCDIKNSSELQMFQLTKFVSCALSADAINILRSIFGMQRSNICTYDFQSQCHIWNSINLFPANTHTRRSVFSRFILSFLWVCWARLCTYVCVCSVLFYEFLFNFCTELTCRVTPPILLGTKCSSLGAIDANCCIRARVPLNPKIVLAKLLISMAKVYGNIREPIDCHCLHFVCFAVLCVSVYCILYMSSQYIHILRSYAA